MITLSRRLALLGAAAGLAIAALTHSHDATAADKVRVAYGDVPTVESLPILIALERAKEKGVDIEFTSLKSEDIAAQAVIGGQADIGIGTPYALIQKVKAPVRMFYQLATLKFYPVVNTEYYKDWKDLDGEDITVHSRGSGTEAIMKLMAQRHGIKYKTMSYVPGSEGRGGALMQGNIKATILDSTNTHLVMEKMPGKFAVLPMEGINASDEALYANTDFLTKNAAAVDTIVEALVTTTREINKNPAAAAELRAKYKLLSDLPKDLEADIVPYYTEAAQSKMLPDNGGSAEAVKDDLDFYSIAGQLQGDAASLKADDFWDLGPLNRAIAKLGKM